MTRTEYMSTYWKMYKSIEEDYIKIFQYVEMDLGDNNLYSDDEQTITQTGNSMTYSIEFVKHYVIICSAVDDILKAICIEEDGKRLDNMKKYASSILSNDFYKKVVSQKVMTGKTELQPFINWSRTPEHHIYWWTEYCDIKHNLSQYIYKANLKNTINALAGLYILNMYYVKRISDNYCRNTHDNLDCGKSPVSMEQFDVPIERSKIFVMLNWDTRVTSIGYDSYAQIE